jgi:hypothetical protein
LRQIAAYLAKQAYTTRTGKPFTASIGAIRVGDKDKDDPMKYIVAALFLFAAYQGYAFVRDVFSHERFEANRCQWDGAKAAARDYFCLAVLLVAPTAQQRYLTRTAIPPLRTINIKELRL